MPINTGEVISDLHTVYPQTNTSYSITVTDNCDSPSDEAIKNCEIAIGLNPDFGAAYNNRGYAYELLGKLTEAELDYEISCHLGEPFGCTNLEQLKTAK